MEREAELSVLTPDNAPSDSDSSEERVEREMKKARSQKQELDKQKQHYFNSQPHTSFSEQFGPGQTTSCVPHALSVDIHSSIAAIVQKYLLRSEHGFEEAEARHKAKVDIGEVYASDGNRGRIRLQNLRNTVIPNPPPSQPDAAANEGLLHDHAQLRRPLLHKQHETEFLVAAMRDRIQNKTANANNQTIRAAQIVSRDTAQFRSMSTSYIINTFVESES
ncbi:hypothetical protein BLNAU_19694 [Blattamonas nauphoetae]|uniref:Uncharacterized protein n=1 Tax=Blattamonas nauphoetae TaxID=2049346 RepID=A0ABQ9X0T1_9EUKA|nr:hypothetical protein BLNAU_19694 [Blattamonas nauphoetae]